MPAYLVRDNDRAYGHIFTSRVRAMGIRDRPISPGLPWQNGIAARLIGTIRHECLDRILIFGESQLRRVLASYSAYYNQTRTHLALQKDAPLRRAVQRYGQIVTIPILSGPIINMCGCDFRKGQVQPETILRWHRAGFKPFWRWKSRNRVGRPKIDRGLRDLIQRMSRENPLWGASLSF
jgi:hypothetical protein